MDILGNVNFKCSVSSVLNKEIKQYGKQFMFDQNEDTSWSSDEGAPQWIALSFDEPQALSAFSIQFQGGFVGQKSNLYVYSQDNELILNEPFYPEDINSVQHFKLKDEVCTSKCSKIKLVFGASTDFFGRIIVYKLRLFN